LDWPCGQNPGRKPEGRRRASTREAMSLGKQSSTCRASFLSALPKRTEFRRPRGTREGSWAASPKAWALVGTRCSTTYWSSRKAAARNGSRPSGTRRSLSATLSRRRPTHIGYWPSSPVTDPSMASSKPSGRVQPLEFVMQLPTQVHDPRRLPATAGSTRSAEDPRDRELSPLSGRCREAGLAGARRPVEEASACEAGLGSAPRRRLAAR
jgi:hypothetical protein